MTRPFRIRRLALLTASTAVVAGGALVPTAAFAATPTAPHAVVGDSADDGNKSNLMWIAPPGSGSLFERSPEESLPDGEPPAEEVPPETLPDDVLPDGDDSGDYANIPGEPDSGSGILIGTPGPGDPPLLGTGNPDGKPQWQCVAAPCGSPGFFLP
ncbi:hypothetical protein ACWGE1_35460 [Streptomyces sp. NPDC054932]